MRASFEKRRPNPLAMRPALAAWIVCLLAPVCGPAAAVRDTFPMTHVPVLAAVEAEGPWRFRFDLLDQGIEAGWSNADTDASAWQAVRLPAVWNSPAGDLALPVRQGVGWYLADLPVPPGWTNDVTLVLLGAQMSADVWANGAYLGVHRHAYSPAFFDLTPHATPGGNLRVAIRVQNTHDADGVPNGSHCGWQIYGGLTREVFLLHQPRVRLAGVRWETLSLTTGRARVRVRARFNRPLAGDAWSVRLLTAEGAEVAAAQARPPAEPGAETSVEFDVPAPRPWSPDDPYRYRLGLAWPGGAHEMPVGLRTIAVDGPRLLLNGAPIWLQGFGRHETAPDKSPIMAPDLLRRDLETMKRVFQANVLRAGHYPNHPALYNLADELGLLVFTEIPAWQIAPRIMESEAGWEGWLKPQLTAMVDNLAHHPSVFLWGLANETRQSPGYFARGVELLRALDPTRPSTAVLDSTYDPASDAFFDLVARNLHYGWYHSASVYEARRHVAAALANAGNKPLFVAEIGGLSAADSLGGGYGDSSRGTLTYLDKTLRFNFQFDATASPRIAGISVWTWTDFMWDNRLDAHGVLAVDRAPKLPAYTMCMLMRGEVRLFVTEHEAMVAPGEAWRAQLIAFNPRGRERPGLTVDWRILKRGEQRASGSASFDLTADRSQPVAAVEWAPGSGAEPGLYMFWAELRDGAAVLHTNTSFFDYAEPSRPGLLELTPYDGMPDPTWVDVAGVRLPAFPAVGLILPLEAGIYPVNVSAAGGPASAQTLNIDTGRITRASLQWP